MRSADRLHAAAVELAEQIATRLTRLEPESEIRPMVARLHALVARLELRVAGGGAR